MTISCFPSATSPLYTIFNTSASEMQQLYDGPPTRRGEERGKTELWGQECSHSYYNRLVKTWRTEKLHPSGLENNTRTALTPSLPLPDTAIIKAWGMLEPQHMHDLHALNKFKNKDAFHFWDDHHRENIVPLYRQYMSMHVQGWAVTFTFRLLYDAAGPSTRRFTV